MNRRLTVALALALAIIAGAPGSGQPVGELLEPGDDGRVSATLVGELVAGETGRLAVRWEGPEAALLDAWVDLDGDGAPGPRELVAAERPLAPGIEVLTFDLAPDVQVVPEPRVWVSVHAVPETLTNKETDEAPAPENSTECAWDTGFTAPDLDDEVYAMAVFDDGSGPALYVGGSFSAASGLLVNHIARWDGSEWSALSGPSGTGVNGIVRALTVFDDGSGSALYAGGEFWTAGGVTVSFIARWDGGGWSALHGPSGTGVSNQVLALAAFDDGAGPALFVGGSFTTAGGVAVNRVARWRDGAWSALSGPSGTGVGGSSYPRVEALSVFDDGSGPALFAGGSFETAGGVTVNHIARWDGTFWSALSGPAGTGVESSASTPVLVLTVFDDGSGDALYAGGNFTIAGGVTVNRIARWDGTAWSPLSGPAGTGVNANRVGAMAVFDDGSGPALYVGGYFWTAGGVAANAIARWNGTAWSSLGEGDLAPYPNALATYDDGAGTALYVGGLIRLADSVGVNYIVEWEGSTWSPLSAPSGLGTNDDVLAFAFFDDTSPGQLFAGGRFSTAGGVAVRGISRRDGSSWSAPGGSSPWSEGATIINSMVPLRTGSQSGLIAAGIFRVLGSTTVNHIALWDGISWSPMAGPSGIGMGSVVNTLAVLDDGNRDYLYAGGFFITAGGVTVNRIARWDGSSWSALEGPIGTGVDGESTHTSVNALAVFDDGTGPALYAGGLFATAGGVTVNNIARWDGSSWSPLTGPSGTGTDNTVYALTVFDDGNGPALYAGGSFTSAGGVAVNRIARWDGTSWSALTGPSGTGVNSWVYALSVFDDGSGSALYAGGAFSTAGGVTVNRIARWDGSAWSAVTTPSGTGTNGGGVYAFAPTYETSGSVLYVGGEFTLAGGIPSSRIAALRCGPDTTPPSDPTFLTSTTHTPGAWSQSTAIGIQWDGAADIGGSGLAGYSVLFDSEPATVPDRTLEVAHTTGPFELSSGALADGAHTFHLRTCDHAVNCSAGVHLGPFGIDTTPPGMVADLTSPSHPLGTPTADPTVDLSWTAAADATSGVAGYGVELSPYPAGGCGQAPPATTGPSFTSPPLADGAWYALVCAVDAAGNWGEVATAGPFVVDTTAPVVAAVGSEGGTADGFVTEGEGVLAAVTQLAITFSERILPVGADRGVADPSHYRLLDLAADGVLSTPWCGGTPAGDDEDVALAGAWAWTGDRTVSIQLEGATGLAAGRYALLVCDVEDVPGNAMAAPWLRSFTVSADNLLINPSFDSSGDGAWETASPNAQDIRFVAQDASTEASGMVVVDPAAGAGGLFELSQCLEVVEGTPLAFGGLALVDSPLATAPTLKAVVRFFKSTGCVEPMETTEVVLAVGTTHWRWTPRLLLPAQAPVGARSARVGFVVEGGAADHFSLYLDEAAVFADVLLVDGFETGDTGWWTTTAAVPGH